MSIEKWEFVYCATPGRLNHKIREIMTYVIMKKHVPIHPFQVYPYELFEGGYFSREETMQFCKRLIRFCDKTWLFGISEGVIDDVSGSIMLNHPIELHLNFDPEWKKYFLKLRAESKYTQILDVLFKKYPVVSV